MLRLPDGMRDRIKAAADENNRSMNAEIVATLEAEYPLPRSSTDEALWLLGELDKIRGMLENEKPQSPEALALQAYSDDISKRLKAAILRQAFDDAKE